LGSLSIFRTGLPAWTKPKDELPHWVTPLATTTPRLEEEYRYDQLWQMNPKRVATDTYDGEKGWN